MDAGYGEAEKKAVQRCFAALRNWNLVCAARLRSFSLSLSTLWGSWVDLLSGRDNHGATLLDSALGATSREAPVDGGLSQPVLERDPWLFQYFEGLYCTGDVRIPTDDGDAYLLFPRHRWVYNKLLIAESQELPHAPHGIMPAHFPVFSKPIYNMRGMGVESRILHNASDYGRHQRPGHMWMQLLEGEHVSSDIAVSDGRPMWWRHAIGRSIGDGMFDYWIVLSERREPIEEYGGEWIRRHLSGYTGIANVETIGGKIIEVHLRFSDQWPDLYGKGWLTALVGLYQHGAWEYSDADRREGYSFALFGPHGVQYRHPSKERLDEVLSLKGVSSVQITFNEDQAPEAHAMPPGGFRLAVINCWELEAGRRARDLLSQSFGLQRPRNGG